MTTVTADTAYRQLLTLFQKGQMSKTQFEKHRENDPGFAAYIREVESARFNAWRS